MVPTCPLNVAAEPVVVPSELTSFNFPVKSPPTTMVSSDSLASPITPWYTKSRSPVTLLLKPAASPVVVPSGLNIFKRPVKSPPTTICPLLRTVIAFTAPFKALPTFVLKVAAEPVVVPSVLTFTSLPVNPPPKR